MAEVYDTANLGITDPAELFSGSNDPGLLDRAALINALDTTDLVIEVAGQLGLIANKHGVEELEESLRQNIFTGRESIQGGSIRSEREVARHFLARSVLNQAELIYDKSYTYKVIDSNSGKSREDVDADLLEELFDATEDFDTHPLVVAFKTLSRESGLLDSDKCMRAQRVVRIVLSGQIPILPIPTAPASEGQNPAA